MAKPSEAYPKKTVRWLRLGLATLCSGIALFAIPLSASAHTGDFVKGIEMIVVLGLIYLLLFMAVLAAVLLWLAWLTLLATCCKRLYREVFQHGSTLHYSRLFRSTFLELTLSQMALVPAGSLIVLGGSAMATTVFSIAVVAQVAFLSCSYYLHRHPSDDSAPRRFEGWIVPTLSMVSSVPALGLWMHWGFSGDYLLSWVVGGLVLALILMILPILAAFKVKVHLSKGIGGVVDPPTRESRINVALIEALLVPVSWLWALWLTAAVSLYRVEGLSIPIITNAFYDVFIRAALIQAVLTLAPNLRLLWSSGRLAWTPIFSSIAPAGAVALLFALAAAGLSVVSSARLNQALMEASPKGGFQEAVRLIEMGADPNGRVLSGPHAGKPLVLAAIATHRWPLVKLLLDKGANPNARDRAGDTALVSAISARQPEIAKLLLERGADPSSRNRQGRTALMSAISLRQTEMAGLLVEKGADLNARDASGVTALMSAVLWGRPGFVKLLLERGADPNAKTDKGQTVLMKALERHQPEIAALLLEKGADPSVRSDRGETALMFAMKQGHPEIAKLLLQRGADPNVRSDQGETALMLAMRMNQPGLVEPLLKKGADPEAKNREGDTALVNAVKRRPPQLQEVQALVENRSDINFRDRVGYTALMWAVRRGHADVARLLVHKGADVNAKSDGGDTALIIAAFRGNTAMARLLVDSGAEVTARNRRGETPLIRAAQNGAPDLVQFLLDKGADVSDTSNRGNTPLVCACLSGRTEVVRILRKHGAGENMPLATAALVGDLEAAKRLINGGVDTNQKDMGGRTALMWAARQGHPDIVDLLLKNGAAVNATCASGWTALMWAVKNGQLETSMLLIDRGADVEAKTDSGQTVVQMVDPQHRVLLELLKARSGKGP